MRADRTEKSRNTHTEMSTVNGEKKNEKMKAQQNFPQKKLRK